jgi:olefin beta-lactone synthetase
MNLCHILIEQAEKHPARIAIAHQGASLTFSELLDAVRSKADELHRAGLNQGDRALIFVPMSIALYVHLLAVLYVGAVAAFADPWMPRKSLLAACDKLQPQAFIGILKSHLLRLASRAVRRARIKRIVDEGSFRHTTSAQIPIAPVESDHPALITFTTGSTGTPKAALRSHGFLLEQHRILSKHISTREGDADLTLLPIFVLHNLGLGATSVLPNDVSRVGEIETTEIARLRSNYSIRTCTGSPAFFKRCAGAFAGAEPVSLHIGGAPCYPDDIRKISELCPNADITVVYGSTEAEPISEINACHMLAIDSGTYLPAGRPVNEIELRIIEIVDEPIKTDSIDRLTLPAGQIGEICVTGRHVLSAYFNSDDAFKANKIVVGDTVWHRTGDAGSVDANGVLWLAGRVQHRIERNGTTYFVLPAERALRRIDGVRDGTIALHEGKVVAVISASREVGLTEVHTVLPYVDRIVAFNALPYDPRHNAKIDHAAIKTTLSKLSS